MKTAREYVEEMIRYKKSLGYSESTYRVLRNNFVPYVEAGNADGTITEGLLDSWCLRRKSENDNGYIRRMSSIRSLINETVINPPAGAGETNRCQRRCLE